MRIAITLFRLLMVVALQIAPVWGKVLVRWTQPVVPPAATLGVNELVLVWNAGFDQLLQTARRQGYRVYVETAVENVAAVINASRKNLIAGIILNFDDSERSQSGTPSGSQVQISWHGVSNPRYERKAAANEGADGV